jgi:hypothetical protein
MKMLLHEMLVAVDQNIVHPIQVSLKKERETLLACLWLPPRSFISSYVLSLHLLSWGSRDMPVLLTEVTREWEAAIAMEVARVTVVLAIETSTQEVAAAQDSVALHVKDVEDRSTLVEREVLEWVLRVKAENTVTFASTHEDVEGFVRKIALLEGELVAERRAREVTKREHQE